MQNEMTENFRINSTDDEFLTLLEGCYKQLFSMALIHTRNYQDAEDALQDALISAYKNFNGLKNRAFFKTWLTKIVLNIIRKNYKKTKDIHVVEYDSLRIDSDGVNEDGVFVAEMLNVLDEKSRSIVILKYFSGYTVPEISSIMKIREGTVKSRLSRSLQKMNESFNGRDIL